MWVYILKWAQLAHFQNKFVYQSQVLPHMHRLLTAWYEKKIHNSFELTFILPYFFTVSMFEPPKIRLECGVRNWHKMIKYKNIIFYISFMDFHKIRMFTHGRQQMV